MNNRNILKMKRSNFVDYVVAEVSNHPAFDEALGQNMNLRNKVISFGSKNPRNLDVWADDLKNITAHLRRLKSTGKVYVRGSDIKDLVYIRKLIREYNQSRSITGRIKSLFSRKK